MLAGPSDGGKVVGGGGGGGGAMQWSTGSDQIHRDALHVGVGPDVDVRLPSDMRLRFIIDTLAVYVLKDGCELEQIVMEVEQKSPEYAFLFDLKSPEHCYYRWVEGGGVRGSRRALSMLSCLISRVQSTATIGGWRVEGLGGAEEP